GFIDSHRRVPNLRGIGWTRSGSDRGWLGRSSPRGLLAISLRVDSLSRRAHRERGRAHRATAGRPRDLHRRSRDAAAHSAKPISGTGFGNRTLSRSRNPLMRIGSVMHAEKDPVTGEEIPAPMELVRLAIPHRVYTQSHIDYVIEAILDVYERRDSIPGVRIVSQPKFLRHFTARFEPIEFVGGPGVSEGLTAEVVLPDGRADATREVLLS